MYNARPAGRQGAQAPGSPRRRCTARGCTFTPSARSPGAASFRASGASCGSWWRPWRMTPRRPPSPAADDGSRRPTSQAPRADAGPPSATPAARAWPGYRITRDGEPHRAAPAAPASSTTPPRSGVHVYTVSAYDRAGNVSDESAPQVAGRDTIAPATPAPPRQSPTDSAPAISWDAVVDDGVGRRAVPDPAGTARRSARRPGRASPTRTLEPRLAYVRRARARPRRQRLAVVGSAGRALRASGHATSRRRPSRARSASRIDGGSATVTWDAASDDTGRHGLRRVLRRGQGRHARPRDAARLRRRLRPRLHLRRGRVDAAGNRSDGRPDGDHRRLPGGDTTPPSDPAATCRCR